MENPAWKRNVDEPLNRALIAVEALRADLLFPAADEDLPVLPAADQRDPEAMNDLALLPAGGRAGRGRAELVVTRCDGRERGRDALDQPVPDLGRGGQY